MVGLLNSHAHMAPNVINFSFPVKISPDDIVCFDKSVQFFLEIFILMSEKCRMLLQSFILCFKV